MESTWTGSIPWIPCGFHMEWGSFHMDSTWNGVQSTWIPHGMEFSPHGFHMEGRWPQNITWCTHKRGHLWCFTVFTFTFIICVHLLAVNERQWVLMRFVGVGFVVFFGHWCVWERWGADAGGWWQGSSGQGCWGVCWRGMGLISSWGLRTPLWACWAVTGVQWVAELALVDGTHLGMAPLSSWASGVASTLFSVHLGIVKGFKTPQGSGVGSGGVRVRVGMSIPLQNPYHGQQSRVWTKTKIFVYITFIYPKTGILPSKNIVFDLYEGISCGIRVLFTYF